MSVRTYGSGRSRTRPAAPRLERAPSYPGISLFEDENVVSARYDLKKGFGIKVTSGQRETGLDVSYTIER